MPILVDKVGSEGEAGVYTGNKDFYPVNPLAQPLPWWSKLYKLPWSLRYNIGITEEAILKDKIIRLAIDTVNRIYSPKTISYISL